MVTCALVAASGCVSKVSGGHSVAVPLVRDTVTGHYNRPAEQVYDAAKQVVEANGTLAEEKTLYGTNAVKTIEAKVNQCNVWIRVEKGTEPQITDISVQVRTQGGGANLDLAVELDKQIYGKLLVR